jgi:hypothetical protein
MTESAETLLRHLLEEQRQLRRQLQDTNVIAATTASAIKGLRKDSDARHRDNQKSIGKLRVGLGDLNAAHKRVEADLQKVGADVAIMKPVVRRLRARELVRRGIVQCVARWKTMIVALGVALGAFVTWLDGHWPKVASLIHKLRGLLPLVALLLDGGAVL